MFIVVGNFSNTILFSFLLKFFIKKCGKEAIKLKEEMCLLKESNLIKNIKKILKNYSKALFINDFQIENCKVIRVSFDEKEIENFEILIPFEQIKTISIQLEIPNKGKLEIKRGNKTCFYLGTFERGIPNGEGKIFSEEKIIWQGTFKDGLEYSGSGTIEWRDELNIVWLYTGSFLFFLYFFFFLLFKIR